jgi:hypothetical protein
VKLLILIEYFVALDRKLPLASWGFEFESHINSVLLMEYFLTGVVHYIK